MNDSIYMKSFEKSLEDEHEQLSEIQHLYSPVNLKINNFLHNF